MAIEMFEVKRNLAPIIMTEVFRLKTRSFNTEHKSEFQRRNVKTVIYRSETASPLGPEVWDLISIELRNLTSLNAFKSEIKSWFSQQCLCRLSKKYINSLGFIN